MNHSPDLFRLIDLTYPLSSSIPSWNGSCAFELSNEDQIQMLTSAGTHIDAPSYFFDKGLSIDILSLEQLYGPACVLDVSQKAHPSYAISPSDINDYEKAFGPISEGSIVIANTGWGERWQNPDLYRNINARGQTEFPTFSLAAIQLLVEKNVAGIAIDTLALESLYSNFPCHKLLLGANKYIIENIANVSQLPPKGAYILALPLKIENGYEAPARVIGLIPKQF